MGQQRSALRFLVTGILIVTLTYVYVTRYQRAMHVAVVKSKQIQKVYARSPTDEFAAVVDSFAAGTGHEAHAAHQAHQASHNAAKKRFFKVGGSRRGTGYHHRHYFLARNIGYMQSDAFHTKNGDKYGYEKYSSFGKKYGGKKYGVYFAGSHTDVVVVMDVARAGAARVRQGLRPQSLQDVSGDASVARENSQLRRGLHQDDMFFGDAEGARGL